MQQWKERIVTAAAIASDDLDLSVPHEGDQAIQINVTFDIHGALR